MLPHDRTAGGLRCSDVLAVLSRYLDDDLPELRRVQIRAHLAECDTCERFGGVFATTLAALRDALGVPPPVAADMAARLRARLDAER
ncbi:MAG: zf-HC2 domain-containing protein [Vicinamibacterales bacterium]